VDREAATNKLTEDDLARPFLERLARSADAEVAARSRQIIARQDQAHFKRYIQYGQDGQVERMVEGLCNWTGSIDNADFWKEVQRVVLGIWNRLGAEEFDRPSRPNDFLKNMERAKVAPVFRRLARPSAGQVLNGGFISPGPLAVDGHLANATVISTGPISVDGGSASVILLTTEDFTSGESYDSRVAHFTIVSAGRVVLHRNVDSSLVIAHGDIDVTGCRIGPLTNHFATAGKLVGTDKLATGTKLRVKLPPEDTLRLIHWFETSTVGFEATATDSGIKVCSVVPDSEAAEAGLKSGDLITALDGRPAEKAIDGFRKQLRRGSVQDRCYLTVRRDGKSETLMLDFRGDNRK
jgi:hypothetical protein